MSKTVGIAVITHCAKHHLPYCLPPLLSSKLRPKVLVVNSSSQDGTVELAKELGAETLVIPRAEFNHGATREMARKALGTDIVIMVTPDAYMVNKDGLEQLIAPIVNGEARACYAKQIAHDGAAFFEWFHRDFNYPEESQLRGIEDLARYGAYTFFCSNSFAAYCNHALDEVGGFEHVLLGEDTVAVSKLLRKGYKVAYVAESVVKHSHSYTLKQEFQRTFDTGLARKGYAHHFEGATSDSKRGMEYTKIMFKRLLRERPKAIPYAIIQTCVRFAAYKIGRASVNAPTWLKRRLSSQDFYWSHFSNELQS
jgi:rhamnosyltransferase